jgi:YVTN family beta-propeller protein
MYVTNPAASSISVIDSPTNTVVENISAIPSSLGIVSDPNNGDLYVTNYNPDPATVNTISVINETANDLVSTIPTGGSGATGIAFNPNNGDLYVTNWYSQTVSVIPTFDLVGGQEQTSSQPDQQQQQQDQLQPISPPPLPSP